MKEKMIKMTEFDNRNYQASSFETKSLSPVFFLFFFLPHLQGRALCSALGRTERLPW
jgi:hypothetical protein